MGLGLEEGEEEDEGSGGVAYLLPREDPREDPRGGRREGSQPMSRVRALSSWLLRPRAATTTLPSAKAAATAPAHARSKSDGDMLRRRSNSNSNSNSSGSGSGSESSEARSKAKGGISRSRMLSSDDLSLLVATQERKEELARLNFAVRERMEKARLVAQMRKSELKALRAIVTAAAADVEKVKRERAALQDQQLL